MYVENDTGLTLGLHKTHWPLDQQKRAKTGLSRKNTRKKGGLTRDIVQCTQKHVLRCKQTLVKFAVTSRMRGVSLNNLACAHSCRIVSPLA